MAPPLSVSALEISGLSLASKVRCDETATAATDAQVAGLKRVRGRCLASRVGHGKWTNATPSADYQRVARSWPTHLSWLASPPDKHRQPVGHTVGIANTRGPDSIASMAKDLGGKVVPLTLQEALKADVIILAVPFWSHREVANAVPTWQGKIVIDATNACGVPLSDLDHLPSSAIVANALPGAHLVKAFNHLPAGVLVQDPATAAGRRVIFLSGDDEGATATVAALVQQLGYAPVSFGKIAEGGQLVQAQDKGWAPLIFQDPFKKEK